MNTEIRQKFCDLLGEDRVLFREPMSRHTTFRIGGPAEIFLMPESFEQIRDILLLCRQEQLPYFVLGNGSNLLVSDSGYRGVIIQMDRNMGDIKLEGTEIRACAGALLSSIAAVARKASLTGFEFAGGIPGTLGGAAVMNAGAYGGEMKDVLREVTVMTKDGEILTLPAERLEMGYRTSIIRKSGYLVLEAVISLEPGDPREILDRTKELAEKRTEKQPLDYPSAGSTFKRPEGYHGQRASGVPCGRRPGIGKTLRICDQYRRRHRERCERADGSCDPHSERKIRSNTGTGSEISGGILKNRR